MNDQLNYEILIPAYNAGNTISALLEELGNLTRKPQKITVVNDGSQDDTRENCKRFAVEVINIEQNSGKGRALKNGIQDFLDRSSADYLLCMDADLQHPVSCVSDFLKTANQTGSQLIIGARPRSVKTMPVHRILSNAITSLILTRLTGQQIQDSQCGFRLIHRNVLQRLRLIENGYQFETEMLLKAADAGINLYFVPIPTIYQSEKSHMRNVRDTILFIKLIIRYLLKRA